MRKINVKLLLTLVLGTATLAAAVGAAHAFQYGRIADALLFQARRADGQPKRVARYLARYLEFKPRDLDTRAELARILAGEAFAGSPRERVRAARLLDGVLTDDPSRTELRRLLARVALEINQLQTARRQLDALVPEKDVAWPAGEKAPAADASRGELEFLWGRLCEAESKQTQAIVFYRQAIHDLPGEQLGYLRLAYLLHGQNQKETDPARRSVNQAEADDVMDRLVANNQESYRAYLARWNYRRETGYLYEEDSLGGKRLEEAAEDVAKALTRARGESVEVLLAASDLAQLRADVEAEKPDDPKDPKASLERRQKRMREYREEARDYLTQGLKVQEKAGSGPEAESVRRQLLWVLANLWLDEIDGPCADPASAEGKKAGKEARQLTDQLRKTKGPVGSAPAEVLQARLWMSEKEWANAAKLLEHARPALISPQELATRLDLYLGRCYSHMGQSMRALAAYQRVADRPSQADGSLSVARLGMAEARWALGRVDEAVQDYRQVMRGSRVPASGWIDLARLEVENQLQRQENNRDWSQADRDVDRAASANPGVADVTVLRAEVLVGKGRPDQAEALLKKACEADPKKAEYWVALATLADHDGERYHALAVLADAEKVLGDCVELRLARARFWSGRPDDKQRREALAALAKNADKLPADDRAKLLAGLAEAQYFAGDPVAARALLEELATLPAYKNDLRLRLVLFDLALKSGNESRMQAALDSIRAAEGRAGRYTYFGQALRDLWLARERKDTGKLQSAVALLAQVEQAEPQWPRLFLARADAEELAGNPEAAISNLREAIKFGEDGPEAVQRLVTLLTQQKRDDEANSAMGQLRESQRRNRQMLDFGSKLKARQGDLAGALELARQAGTEKSKDWRDLVWLAKVQEADRKYKEAEENLRKAIAMAPAEPDPRVALVHLLAGQKRTAEAEGVIKEAVAQVAPDRAPLAAAQCYEAMGFLNKAAPYFEEAVRKQPDEVTTVRAAARFYLQFGRLDLATVLLQRIVDRKLRNASEQDAAWARHGLAVMLAASTDYRSFQKALGLVEMRLDESGVLRDAANSAQRPHGSDDELARARVLATQPQRQFREKAVELLEAAARAGRLEHGDLFILALLYDAGGNWPGASEAFRSLVLKQGKTPQYLAQYALRLIRQGEVDTASRLVEALEKLEEERDVPPGQFGTVELRARLLEKRGDGNKALELLKNYVHRPRARPDEMLYLIASLGRQQRFAEAFGLCPEAWEKCPPEAAGGVTVALLRVMKPTDAQVARAEGWLKEAIEKHPKNMALRMHLADLFDLRGRYADSEREYRVVLQAEPGNVIALNNLAWLLVNNGNGGAEALTLIDAAVNGLGRRADLLDTRGQVYLKLGKIDEALSDLKESSADMPSPTRLYHLARALQTAKEKDAAKKALQDAVKLGLVVATLHPIEQEDCKRLLEEFKIQ
jgi:predicted Zn-dependent protease